MKQEILNLVDEKKKYIYILDQLNSQEGKHIENHLDVLYGLKEHLGVYGLKYYYRTHPSLILFQSENNRSCWVFSFTIKDGEWKWTKNTCLFQTHFKNDIYGFRKLRAFTRISTLFVEHKEEIEKSMAEIDKTYEETRREILYQINERNRQIGMLWEREIYPKIFKYLNEGGEIEFKEEFKCKYKQMYPQRILVKKIKINSLSASKKTVNATVWNSKGVHEIRMKRRKMEELIRKYFHESNQEIIDDYMWVLKQVKI